MAWTIFGQLDWLTTRVKRLCCAVKELQEGGGTAYKVYRATMYQQNDNPPVVTVLENTLDGDIFWEYLGVGSYQGTLVGAFPLDKTHILYNHRVSDDSGASLYDVYMFRNSNDLLQITTWNGGVPQDGLISGGVAQLSVEIKVYP